MIVMRMLMIMTDDDDIVDVDGWKRLWTWWFRFQSDWMNVTITIRIKLVKIFSAEFFKFDWKRSEPKKFCLSTFSCWFGENNIKSVRKKGHVQPRNLSNNFLIQEMGNENRKSIISSRRLSEINLSKTLSFP